MKLIPIFAITILSLNADNINMSAQNSGKTGLIEMPNARILEDWSMRPYFYYSDPFIYYGLALSPLPMMEINLRMTQVQDIPGFDNSAGYGDYKDKAIDLKFLLKKEDEFWPAIALGFDDIHGTGLYSSKYLVASKRYKNLDFTIGYALGRMGGENLTKYGISGSDDRGIDFLKSTDFVGGSLFGGVEAKITPKISIKAEYSPINYKYDTVNPFLANKTEMPKSHINAGLNYRATDNLTISANIERGNSFGVGINYAFGLKKEALYPHQPDPRWKATIDTPTKLNSYSDENLSNYISDEVVAEKYSNVQVAINKNKIWVSFENPKYNSSIKAIGRVADVIDEVAPARIDDFYIVLKQTNLEYTSLHINRSEIARIKKDPKLVLDKKDFKFSNDIEGEYANFSDSNNIVKTQSAGQKKFSWIFKPSLQTYLNDQENPFTYKVSILGGARYEVAPGGFLYGRLRVPLLNTTDSISPRVLEPANLATRTDSLKYIQYNGLQLEDLVYDQVFKLPYGLYGRGEIGYFEPAYGGIDLELYKPLMDGRFGIGLEYQKVKKREVDNLFGFEDTYFDGKFINLYANIIPSLGLKATAKVGEFFAGDRGVQVTVMREFKDFTIGAFMSKTDTDMFTSSSNRGYIDKGIFIKIPLSTIMPKDVKGSLSYSLKPWTRDVAQYANQVNSLVGMRPANIYEIENDLEMFKE